MQAPAGKALRAALYCRVSTNKQERDGTSLDTQETEGRAYIERQGYSLDERHVWREAASGFTLDRPKLRALREEVRRGEIVVVVVYALSRLSRQQAHMAVIIYDIEGEERRHHARLESVTEVFEDTAVGRLIRSTHAFAAEVWREQHIERTLRGKQARARNGALLPASNPACGYLWRPPLEGQKPHSALDIDPSKAPIVRRIFETLAAGGTLVRLQRDFEREGLPATKGGKRWPISTLRTIVVNPLYKGEPEAWRHYDDRTERGTIVKRLRPEDERIKLPAGVAPPLVTPELWQRANDQLALNIRHCARRLRNPESFLLHGGFVKCPHCHRA